MTFVLRLKLQAALVIALFGFIATTLLLLYTLGRSELEPMNIDAGHGRLDGSRTKVQRRSEPKMTDLEQPPPYLPLLRVKNKRIAPLRISQRKGGIQVSVVICGERAEEAITMLKTATLFSQRSLTFHIVAEDDLQANINNILNKWPCVQSGRVNFKIYSPSFPGHEWKKLFKPCATQRLFLPAILNDEDSVLYMDSDTMILCPIEEIWNHFSRFNSTQLASLSPEAEEPTFNWYNRFARHPYYGKLGVNSGVMLMNLTRMRAMSWEDHILPIYKKYRYDITWGDQDILNILFHFNPELVYILGCEWNYRTDHCIFGINCKTTKPNGIAVLHGSRGAFHDHGKQPVFKTVYEAMRDFKHGSNMQDLLVKLHKQLHVHRGTNCGEIKDELLHYLLKQSHNTA